jgi:hypothetical protein
LGVPERIVDGLPRDLVELAGSNVEDEAAK